MNTRFFSLVPLVLVGLLAGCSSKPAKSPDVENSVRTALDSRGLNDVSVSQDRDKGIVTLSGKVRSDDAKAQAASVAQAIASGQVVANQITVEPAGMERDARKMADALDDGIDSNMKALLVGMQLDNVKYAVDAGVVTLTGTVSSQAQRANVEKAAAGVANVKQVVNELQVTNQKATTRKRGA